MKKRTTRKILVPTKHVPNVVGLGYAVRAHEVGNLAVKPGRSELVLDRDNASRDDLIAASRGANELHIHSVEGVTKTHAPLHKASLQQERKKRFATELVKPDEQTPAQQPKLERDQGLQR